MVNIVVIAAIFVLVLLIIAGFVSQQFSAAQQITQNKKPKSLQEKLNKGVGAMETDKFREIVMEGGGEAEVEKLVGEGERSGKSKPSIGARHADEQPDNLAFDDELVGTSGVLNLEGKDLQTIYSEYLSEKNVNPFDMEPDFKLGVAYLKFSHFEKAINQFKKVIDEKPDFAGIYYYLGEAYRCNGQFYEAMEAYKQSWEQDTAARQKKEEEEREAKAHKEEEPAAEELE